MTDLDRLSDYAEHAEMPPDRRTMLRDAVAELRAHRERARIGCTDEEHLLGMSELRELKKKRCETCADARPTTPAELDDTDLGIWCNWLMRRCSKTGNGCNAWRKRESQ